MATPISTDNLITFANAVYLEVNESPQTSTSNSLGIRIKTSINNALVDLCTLADWPWMLSFQPAESWVNEIATLPANTRQVKFVTQNRTGGGRRLPSFLPAETFYQQNLRSFTGAGGGIVDNYTQLDYRSVAVNDYPADSASQAEVLFYIVRFVTLPTSDSSQFAVPDEYMELLKLKTTANFALSHLADRALAEAFNQRYADLAQRYRNKIRNAPNTGNNMYRNWRK